MQTSSYDIIIVGSGIVGAALACALAQQTSLTIAILEAQTSGAHWVREQYHHRVSAVALSSQRIFRALHLWQDMHAMRVSPFTKIQVWDAATHAEINFDSRDIAEGLLGYIIENNAMHAALLKKIRDYPQIDIIAPVQLAEFNSYDSHVELIDQAGKTYKAALAVAADGAHSWLRTQAGIAITQHDYEQEALVATVHTAIPHQQIARQVFLDTGPLAFLPLLEQSASSIVWSLPVQEARHYAAMEMDRFKHALATAFSQRLGDVLAVEKRFTFPLRKQETSQYVLPRLALVGDAAHTVHPLAGQGVNMGLLDAASLAEVIVTAVKQRRDYASIATLRKYERWRRADNMALLSGVDAIKNLFASDKKSIQGLRSCGLNITNKINLLKNIFTRHAVGDRGGLPILAR